MIRAIAILIATIVCLVSCKKDSHGRVPPDVNPLLSESEVAQLGFKTIAVRASVQHKWDQGQFGSARIIEQDIKSLNPMDADSLTFPRYTVIRESYDRPETAANRFKRLRDFDPDLDGKMNPGLLLRDGFTSGEHVWIVTTDAVVFSHHELQKLKGNLEALKKPKAEDAVGGNGG